MLVMTMAPSPSIWLTPSDCSPLIRCFYRPTFRTNSPRSIFGDFAWVFPQILVDFQSNSTDFLCHFSIRFSQLNQFESILINFNHFFFCYAGTWESAKESHKRLFGLLPPEKPQPEMAKMLQKPVFALPGCQPIMIISVNTLLCVCVILWGYVDVLLTAGRWG